MKYAKNWLSPNEIKTILALPGLPEKYEIWVLLLYVPALRVMEAINVRVKDLNFSERCVDVWGGKGKDSTELQKAPCTVDALNKFKRYCEHFNLRPNDYIMFSQKQPQTTQPNVYIQFNRLCRLAGIDKKIGTHTMRRSRAESLLDSGLSLTFVSRYLRHKNLSTTMNYLDISISDIQRALENIDDPVGAMIL